MDSSDSDYLKGSICIFNPRTTCRWAGFICSAFPVPAHFLTLLLVFSRCWCGTHARRSRISPMSPNIRKTLWSLRCESWRVRVRPRNKRVAERARASSPGSRIPFSLLIRLINSLWCKRAAWFQTSGQTRSELITSDLTWLFPHPLLNVNV